MALEHISQPVDPDALDNRRTSVWVRLKHSQARVGIQSTHYSDNSPGEIGVVIDSKYPVGPAKSPHAPRLSELVAAMETIGRLGEQMRVKSTVPSVKAEDGNYLLGYQAVAPTVDYHAGAQPLVWILEFDPRSSQVDRQFRGVFSTLAAAQAAAAKSEGQPLEWNMPNDAMAYADPYANARWLANSWPVDRMDGLGAN